MITKEQQNLARWAMETALKNGCKACRVAIYTGTESSFEVRDTQLDKLQQSESSQLVIQLFVEGRYGSVSTNRLDRDELEKFIKQGIASVKMLAPDEARQLPDPSLYFKGPVQDLKKIDPSYSSISADAKIALANATAAEIFGSDPRLISVTGSYGDGIDYSFMTDSQGFEGSAGSTYFSLSASASVYGEGDARPESYDYDSALFFDDLRKDGIGKKSLEFALRKIGQQKIKSGQYSMLVDNRIAGNLLSPLISALNGSSIQQKSSFLLDKLDQKVVSSKLTLIDNPLLVGAMGAKLFDREGIATVKRNVFEQGVLKTYYIDTYMGNKLKMPVTTGGTSVICFEGGDKSHEQMLAGMKEGIWVTGFNGGNCNGTTGNFSYGVEGFWVENGIVKQPVSEMNITGNMLTLWSNLAEIGNNPVKNSSWRTPGLMFDLVDFSGI